MELKKAKRKQVKLRIGISGPSGFGKTYSALLLAYGMTNDYNKIAVIDTENSSASLYSNLGGFNVLNLNPPFSPENYIRAIQICESSDIEVIVIDSITHEWSGKGGCLEIHEKLGGRFQNWAQVSPRHQSFIDAILQSKCHVITTTRTKIDYSMDKDSSGKTKVIKHGMKEIQREGFEYELTVNFELLNENHLVKASKDRTGLFMDKPEQIIVPALGKKLIKWCNAGSEINDARIAIEKCHDVESLRKVYAEYSNFQREIKPLVIKRREELDEKLKVVPNNKIIEPQKLI